jgi:UDP-N-acetylmuramyl pentapeptide phosphotransferase/UDP-N-acetylglucosamine-1-phosphate transferase
MAVFFSFYLILFFTLFFFAGRNFELKWVTGLALGGMVVSLVGFLDDVKELSPIYRLLAQGVAGFILIFSGLSFKTIEIPFWKEISLGYWGILLALIWVVWIVNLYNFMDGIDGLAAGVGMIAAFFFSLIAGKTGNDLISLSGMILAGCCAGFLIHNFPPAKIFLGDIGSSLIGFLFAGFTLIGNNDLKDPLPVWIPILLLGAFIFDTGVTLLRRMLKGERWFSAHRSHFYQRLINLHLTHRQVSFIEYGLAILLGLSSLLYMKADPILRGCLLIGWVLFFTSGVLMIRFYEKREIGERVGR